MHIRRAILAAGFVVGAMEAAQAQTPHWDLDCHYDNGSGAFLINIADKKTLGDMNAHNGSMNVTPGTITFSVAANDTPLLQAFEVTIDRASLKWSTNHPGYGGTCKKQ